MEDNPLLEDITFWEDTLTWEGNLFWEDNLCWEDNLSWEGNPINCPLCTTQTVVANKLHTVHNTDSGIQ